MYIIKPFDEMTKVQHLVCKIHSVTLYDITT
jgi:hypothetical protein